MRSVMEQVSPTLSGLFDLYFVSLYLARSKTIVNSFPTPTPCQCRPSFRFNVDVNIV